MADVEFNGSQGIIPDFAMEDTQQKILTALQKQLGLNNKELLNAQKILQKEDANSKAQLEAMKDLGKDIQKSVAGKGTFFGGLTSGITSTIGVLGTLGKGIGLAGSVIGGLATAVTAATLNLTKGFGDDLKNAGLAESGAAFGSLGAELNTVVPGLMTLGLSVDEAAGAINSFRGAMTAVSGTAIQGVITQFNDMTNGGAQFGRTISENVEALSEELEYRARLGFLDQRNTAQAAKDAQEVMENQIAASKLLGKSVDEIANGVKDLFTGDLDIAASLANLGPNVEKELRKTFQTFEGAGLPKSFQAGLAKMITDPIMLGSQEAQDTFAAFQVLPDGIGDNVRSSVENLRAAIDSGDKDAIEAANKALEDSMLKAGASIQGLSDEQKEQLFIIGQSNPMIKELLSAQNTMAVAYANATDKTRTELNKSLENSVIFDNQITTIMNSFGALLTAVKSGMSPALESFTTALGSMADENSPIHKFRVRLEEISGKIMEKLNIIFGLTGDQEKNSTRVGNFLGTLADYIGKAADYFLTLINDLVNGDSGSIIDNISSLAMNLISGAFSQIGDGIRNLDIMDLLFGDSQSELEEDASKRLARATRIARRGNPSASVDTSQIMLAMKPMIEKMRDRGNSDKQILSAMKNSGVDIKDPEILKSIFPNPKDLRDAITEVYKDDASKGQEVWSKVSKDLQTNLEEQRKNIESNITSPEKLEELTGRNRKNAERRNAEAEKQLSKIQKEQLELVKADTKLGKTPGDISPTDKSNLNEENTANDVNKPVATSDTDIVEQTETVTDLPNTDLAKQTETVTDLPNTDIVEQTETVTVLPNTDLAKQTEIDLNNNTSIGTQPATPNNNLLEKDPDNAKPTTPEPSIQDDGDLQKTNSQDSTSGGSNQENIMKSTDEKLDQLISVTGDTNKILKSIANSSSATAGNTQ